MGRPQKPYKTTGGTTIDGLARRSDGRWRIIATGEHYTEHDEHRAIARFYAKQPRREPLFIPVFQSPDRLYSRAQARVAVIDQLGEKPFSQTPIISDSDPNLGELHARDAEVGEEIGHLIDEAATWAWVRQQFLERPEYVAQQTGLHASLVLPIASLKLADIVALYTAKCPAVREKSKQVAVQALERLVKFCNATTLDDLTTEKLISYRDSIENDKALKSGGTKRGWFKRAKSVLAFGLKMGSDAAQIRAVLDRCKVLWTATPMPQVNPRPISREDYHKLLNAAIGKYSHWRVWLLLGLNLCLHMIDVCNLQWDTFDLQAKTYATIRGKTAIHRIPQAAVLWDETIAELNKLERQGPYILRSRHGTKYTSGARGAMFGKFRNSVGVKVHFDDLRDGAYTAACMAHIDEKWARLLAGHKSPGLLDSYVLRSPEMVRAATEAVYKHYFG